MADKNVDKQNKSNNGSEKVESKKVSPEVTKVESKVESKSKNGNSTEEKRTMSEKVNTQFAQEDDSVLARLIGLGLILLGVVLILLVIAVVFLSRREPRLDSSIETPTLQAPEYTNEQSISLSGSADADSKVLVYLDDKREEEYADVQSDGDWSYDLKVDDEGEYQIEAAAVKGFPIRRRSEKSDPVTVVVDWTAPSKNATLNYDPNSSTDKFTLRGETEPDTKVIVEGNGRTYSTQSDEDGDFELKGILLNLNENRFKVVLEDRAGNRTELDRLILITYTKPSDDKGDLNGDGIAVTPDTPDLPEASGPLEDALQVIFANKLLLMFGVVALAMFAANSGVVMYKLRKK